MYNIDSITSYVTYLPDDIEFPIQLEFEFVKEIYAEHKRKVFGRLIDHIKLQMELNNYSINTIPYRGLS